MPRIFGLVRDAVARGEKPTDKRNPLFYTLGTGHCRFFYTRLRFLQIRQYSLIEEMLKLGYNPQYRDVVGPHSPGYYFGPLWSQWWNNYVPTEEAIAINRARIKERS